MSRHRIDPAASAKGLPPHGLVVGENAITQMMMGDILGTLQYVEDEAALILSPARGSGPEAGVYVVCASAVPRYVARLPSGGITLDQNYAKEAARRAALTMGMDTTIMTLHRIMDCFFEWIPLLTMLPPKPPELKRLVDEALVSVNGKQRLAQRRV